MSDTPQPWAYRAFLSYSHKDRAAAWRWRWRLEHFRIDVRLIGQATPLGPVPHTLSPIFHDRQDFPAGGELTAMTRAALDGSAALILLASPAASVSDYVNEEVRWFRWKYPDRPVVAIILKGQPGDPDKECFPPAYRSAIDADGAILDTPVDVIAADPRRHGDGRARAQAKVVAGMTGLTVEQVLSRVTDAIRRERAWMFVSVTAMAALVVGVTWRNETLHQEETARRIAAEQLVLENQRAQRAQADALAAAQQESTASARRTEAMVREMAGGAVQAMAGFRDLFRPYQPDIDLFSPEQLVGLAKKVLAARAEPGVNPADFRGAVAAALAQAKRQADDFDLTGAARTLDEALGKREAKAREDAKEDAALLSERGRVASQQTRYREAASFFDKAADALRFDPQAALPHAIAAADALYAQGDEFGDNQALTAAIERRSGILAQTSRQTTPAAWAAAQLRLGSALLCLGERDTGPALLEQAAAAFRLAAEASPRDADAWANAQLGVGVALRTLGEREGGTARLEEAIAAYRLALKEWTQAHMPQHWAATQNNLGNALGALGEREGGTARLEEAVVAYRLALTEQTRAREPLSWARTQNNLGSALWTLGARENGTARLEEAVAAYRLALTERTQARVPLSWAMTQNNLGLALRTLGQRENGTARLEEAVTAHRLALTERTHARVPLDWAETRFDMGFAWEALADRTGDRATLVAAIEATKEAASVFRDGGNSYALPMAEQRIARLEAKLAAMK